MKEKARGLKVLSEECSFRMIQDSLMVRDKNQHQFATQVMRSGFSVPICDCFMSRVHLLMMKTVYNKQTVTVQSLQYSSRRSVPFCYGWFHPNAYWKRCWITKSNAKGPPCKIGWYHWTTATNSPTKATNQGEWVIMKNKSKKSKINLGRSTDLARLVELNSK